MFGKKKPKIEQPITPEELSRLNDKKMADAEIEHFHVKNDSIEIVKYKKAQTAFEHYPFGLHNHSSYSVHCFNACNAMGRLDYQH